MGDVGDGRWFKKGTRWCRKALSSRASSGSSIRLMDLSLLGTLVSKMHEYNCKMDVGDGAGEDYIRAYYAIHCMPALGCCKVQCQGGSASRSKRALG